MIRVALLTIALVAATAAGPVLAASGREVVNVDDGLGHSLVIVRGDGEAGWSGQREVLDYVDGGGAHVRVYADHPVTRGEVDQRLRDAEREGERARQEGRRAAEEGRRAAAEGRREAQAARIEAAQARIEGERAAEEGRREAARARYEAERERAEALADAD